MARLIMRVQEGAVPSKCISIIFMSNPQNRIIRYTTGVTDLVGSAWSWWWLMKSSLRTLGRDDQFDHDLDRLSDGI